MWKDSSGGDCEYDGAKRRLTRAGGMEEGRKKLLKEQKDMREWGFIFVLTADNQLLSLSALYAISVSHDAFVESGGLYRKMLGGTSMQRRGTRRGVVELG